MNEQPWHPPQPLPEETRARGAQALSIICDIGAIRVRECLNDVSTPLGSLVSRGAGAVILKTGEGTSVQYRFYRSVLQAWVEAGMPHFSQGEPNERAGAGRPRGSAAAD